MTLPILQLFMTEGHHILVDPSNLERGENIGKGAFSTVYKAKMKKMTEEVRYNLLDDLITCTHIVLDNF